MGNFIILLQTRYLEINLALAIKKTLNENNKFK